MESITFGFDKSLNTKRVSNLSIKCNDYTTVRK